VHVAIDDFGTGYSSLSYLKRLPVDSIKIDRSFVSQVASQRDDAAIARAIITMAHSLQLKVIAEGVETAEQLAFLTANGCNEVHGYYFSRPLPGADCAAMLGRPRQLKEPRGPSSPPPDSGRRVAIGATPCEEPACVERATMVAALSTGAQQTAMSSGGSRS
jgi:predicted signal transduction protein with EAL and GGDEF domain